MYQNWSFMQPYGTYQYGMRQWPYYQGRFQFQQSVPYTSQQHQWQYTGPYFSPMPPFPNNTTRVANNEKKSFEQYPPQTVHYETEQGQNRVSYERRPNQEQYASYPRDAIYRRASGPGWQRQEVFYPAKSYK